MKVELTDHEFTASELMRYLRLSYGTMINGTEFNNSHLARWSRYGKLPEAYGGGKLTKEICVEFDQYVYTLENISREVYKALLETPIDVPKVLPKVERPHKQRTALYHQIVASSNLKSNLPVKPEAILPDNWRQLGIKAQQIKKRSYK